MRLEEAKSTFQFSFSFIFFGETERAEEIIINSLQNIKVLKLDNLEENNGTFSHNL